MLKPSSRVHVFRLTGLGSLTIALLLGLAGSTAAQMISTGASLERAGLTSLWFTSAELGAGGKIVDWSLDINHSKATTYLRIQAGRYREIISENDLNAYGKPYGLDELVEYGEFRKGILEAELAARGRQDKVVITQYTLPKSTLYILGSNSRITSIDADTGRQNWSIPFGSMSQPNLGIHADDEHVVAVNGTNVYCFEAASGKLIWTHFCRMAVAAAPVVASGKIFVPLFDGRLEIFQIEKQGFGSHWIVASGIPTDRPLVTSRVVAWPTNIGHLNFTAIEGRMSESLIYRLKASDYISSTPTYRDDLVFTGSGDGFVYAIEEHSGKLMWQVSLGSAISQSPFVFGDCVYAITYSRDMYCLDARTGEMRWDHPVSGIGRYLGSSKTKIYLTDGLRSLLVMDPITGAVLSSADVGPVNSILPNRDTDRLYAATNTGVVHCIHEIGSPIPYFHPNKIAAIDFANKGKSSEKEKSGSDADDPFAVDDEASADDPFSEGDDGDMEATDDSDASDNPFGGDDSGSNDDDKVDDDGSNPSSGGEDQGENPFGGSSPDDPVDPFK